MNVATVLGKWKETATVAEQQCSNSKHSSGYTYRESGATTYCNTII